MAFVLNDRVKETTTSTGTGTINLAGAADTFETFVAGIGTTNKCFYCIYFYSTFVLNIQKKRYFLFFLKFFPDTLWMNIWLERI